MLTMMKSNQMATVLSAVLVASLSSSLMACSDTSPVDNGVPTSSNNDATESIDVETADAKSSISAVMSDDEQMVDTLSRYRWTLSTAVDNEEQPISALMSIKDQVTLSFNQQGNHTLNYSVGCNIMSANFELEANTLKIGESMGTKMSCNELDVAENLLNQLMQGSSELQLVVTSGNSSEWPVLTQVMHNHTLIWKGKLTTQAKYSSKGDTIFWEVAAESVPCQNNPSQQCLQVKPVTYNDQGIKTGEGKLVAFAGTIDGYQHDGKHNEVLRLQRFKTDNDTVLVDNLDSEFAYVLDTVIESTIAAGTSTE